MAVPSVSSRRSLPHGSADRNSIRRAAAYLNTLIVIGCGDGVRDENVGGLLRWIEKTLASSSLDHYIVMRTDVADTFALIGGLVVVPYGSSYDDLPAYLESLKSTVEAKSLRADIAAKREQIMGFGSAWVDRNGRFRQEQPSPKSVAGDWTGSQTQQVGPMKEPISYRVGLQLSGDDDGLAGTFYFRFGPQGAPLVEESLAVAGRIDGGRFLRLAYRGGEPEKPLHVPLVDLHRGSRRLRGSAIAACLGRHTLHTGRYRTCNGGGGLGGCAASRPRASWRMPAPLSSKDWSRTRHPRGSWSVLATCSVISTSASTRC